MPHRDYLALLRAWLRQDEQRYVYYCTPDILQKTAPSPVRGLELYTCDAGNLETIREHVSDIPAWAVKRIRRGETAVIAAEAGKLVFITLIILGPRIFTFLGYPFPLTLEDAMMEAAETIPAWRGKGVAPGTLGFTAHALAARGVRHVYLTINVTNTASCRAAEKGGARRIGMMRAHLRYGRWRATFERVQEEIESNLARERPASIT